MPAPMDEATSYGIRLTRRGVDGQDQVIEYEGYGSLRELLDDIERAPRVQTWLSEDTQTEHEPDGE